uniref:C2H2-type domain-containing protein n=1 Tax=Romanomermis culicivorax TaxID=13658 RepID=A0A915ITW0_ROMCU
MLSILTSSHPTDHDGQENGQFFAVATADQPSTATTISAVAATSDYSSNNSPTTGGASSPTTTPSGGGGTTDLGHHPTNQITDEEEEEAVTVDENIDVEEKRQRKVSETDATASASINCPFCNVLLLEPKYLQRHFQEAHGLDENRMQREQKHFMKKQTNYVSGRKNCYHIEKNTITDTRVQCQIRSLSFDESDRKSSKS